MDNQTQTDFEAALQRKIDLKTKPQGALGRIETLAVQVARLQRTLTPRMGRAQLAIFAGDHGIAADGVSAYPAEVTRQMVLNFAGGGAAANVFAAVNGLDLRVVNAGVKGGPFDMAGIYDAPIGPGTASFLRGPAMTSDQCRDALETGRRIGAEGAYDAMACGEMGIGNTSSASVLTHLLTGVELDVVVGRGTGLDDDGLARKRSVLGRAVARVTGPLAPLQALTEFGGFEIAMMTGAMLGAAQARRVVLVDGFIATAAALLAARIEPGSRGAMVFCHRSAEPGHAALLAALQADPLLALDMRLGEGTGAALAWPLVRAAVAMLNDMASFEDAGVSGPA
ncbi:nicotinate-nucleotide--dimethylbenzimidazole phosphoribosyltransferase [Thalassococcus sp. CAU 1522]|uniref:Nicotinate-nucleotide--dimethylbenzimidazole phosphoribosyltransferase n=1 Tax=Thalassococcus arenae TaxID=2851652 RepID=A0ABS6N9N2_9RHOB|nr:nicotinate-nucleotide--dimethylbenzimidazole phosphoribosyltransferase [Thalassococcus arenae]MBV2360717.1 nicotinate-nucleotide--dimethylbenzimidazole phosphoribosyltransferase [Thalassococcus arenae]